MSNENNPLSWFLAGSAALTFPGYFIGAIIVVATLKTMTEEMNRPAPTVTEPIDVPKIEIKKPMESPSVG